MQKGTETPVVEQKIGGVTPIKSHSWFTCSGFPLALALVFNLEGVAAKHTKLSRFFFLN